MCPYLMRSPHVKLTLSLCCCPHVLNASVPMIIYIRTYHALSSCEIDTVLMLVSSCYLLMKKLRCPHALSLSHSCIRPYVFFHEDGRNNAVLMRCPHLLITSVLMFFCIGTVVPLCHCAVPMQFT
jgi:hypothetical protein